MSPALPIWVKRSFSTTKTAFSIGAAPSPTIRRAPSKTVTPGVAGAGAGSVAGSEQALPSDPIAPATRALTDAARVFSLPSVEGYISRGKKDVGIRAFDGQPPFVLAEKQWSRLSAPREAGRPVRRHPLA